MELLVNFLAVVGLIAVLVILVAAAWLGLGEPMDEHWPMGLDEPPLLDVQNHVGDSRPIR
jgi:hypothetical protein